VWVEKLVHALAAASGSPVRFLLGERKKVRNQGWLTARTLTYEDIRPSRTEREGIIPCLGAEQNFTN
jgi:hypothetical protein